MQLPSHHPLPAGLLAKANGLGLDIPSICIPRQDLDLNRWAVIACDQFTSQPDYWRDAADYVGAAPSALRMILPEIYLEHPDDLPVSSRIAQINAIMEQYLANGTLQLLPPGWIGIDRSTPEHPSRKGLVLAIDLECYDFQPGNHQLIRATEGTVLERIPPRLAIRRDAPLELPHIQLLIDDPARTVIEPLLAAAASRPPLYETELMLGGGHVRGWFVAGDSPALAQALAALSQLESLAHHGLLCAVGDGNHSLATAKAHWEAIRSQAGPDHPARYALVEVVNIHDQGLSFEPIHRVVFNIEPDVFLAAADRYFTGQELTVCKTEAGEAAPVSAHSQPDGSQCLPLLWRHESWLLRLGKPRLSLAAASVQGFLDDLGKNAAIRVDYIHGDDVVRDLAAQGHLGLLLPGLDKRQFFDIIAADGILPCKTFSMGEAREKRYYFECRPIR